jgi:quercetin dioxygenase-like cupin family protein
MLSRRGARRIGWTGREENHFMRITWSFACASCLIIALAAIAPGASAEKDEKGFVRLTPDEIEWKSPLGAGIEVAVLQGDPSKPGSVYVQRVKFPPGMFSSPHYHPEDRHVTVIKGTWYAGTGENFDAAKAVPLKAGSYMLHPARAVHWDGAKDEEVIVQIVGVGPAETIPVRPEAGRFISIK